MRDFFGLALGAAMIVPAAAGGFSGPASAGPAYTPEKIIEVFQDKPGVQIKTRSICLQNTADCNKRNPDTTPKAIFNLMVNFEFNSDQLTPSAKENLDQFAKALKDPRLKGDRFAVDGHTDAVGAENYNLDLSDRRAAAVVSYLASQGIDSSLLVAKGFGKAKPIDADPFSARNRRVETHRTD